MNGGYPRSRRGRMGTLEVPVMAPSTEPPPEPNPRGYTTRTDDRAAMQRSRGRSHAELEADRLSGPDLKTGLASRAAAPAQGHNDQHPWGKPDHDEIY